MSLWADADLPLLHLRTGDGAELWCLGWIFLDGERITELSGFSPPDLSLPSVIESRLFTRACGRHLWVLHEAGGESYVIPDGSGSLSVCASTEMPLCVSEPEVAVQAGLQRWDPRLRNLEATCRRQTGFYYPGGFTGIRNLRVVLPNHAFSLRAGTMERFWPVRRRDLRLPGMDRIQEEIVELLRDSILAFSRFSKLCLPITAGRDSRIILSVLAHLKVEEVACYTSGDPRTDDAAIGRRLAESCGYRWQSQALEGDHVCLPGFGGEIFKGYWDRNLQAYHPSERVEAIFRAIPFTHQLSDRHIIAFLRGWIENLTNSGWDDPTILDLAYLEFRWACTMGPVQYQYDDRFSLAMSPFSCRALIENALCLDERTRRRMSFWEEVCRENGTHHLLWLPAGVPEYEKKRFFGVLLLMIAGFPFLPRRTRFLIFSRAAVRGVGATLHTQWRRLARRRKSAGQASVGHEKESAAPLDDSEGSFHLAKEGGDGADLAEAGASTYHP